MGRLLEAVGFRNLVGVLAGGVSAWRDAELPTDSTPAIDVAELAERLRRDDVRLLDVRDDDEWEEGHVAGSQHLPYHGLRDAVPADLRNGGKPLAVACSVGKPQLDRGLASQARRRRGRRPRRRGGVADLEREGVELVRGA